MCHSPNELTGHFSSAFTSVSSNASKTSSWQAAVDISMPRRRNLNLVGDILLKYDLRQLPSSCAIDAHFGSPHAKAPAHSELHSCFTMRNMSRNSNSSKTGLQNDDLRRLIDGSWEQG